MLKALVADIGRFARWRWRTLEEALADLLRIELATVLVASEIPNSSSAFSSP